MGSGNFAVTDGITSVTFLANTSGFNHLNWTPAAPAPKGDGQWSESPFTDGRIPVIRKWNNIIDTYELVPFGVGQDEVIVDLIELRRLLQQAIDYWQNDWETGTAGRPVWIEARGDCETNTRYAYIFDYRIPNDDDPYQPPFGGYGQASIEGFTVVLEHGLWRSTPPGVSECLPISSSANLDNTEDISEPTASSDDAFINASLNTVTLNTASPSMGKNVGGNSLHVGIRFRNVLVPKNAVITQAYVKFHCPTSDANTTCTIRIYGEKSATPAAFTAVYADYTGKALTTALVDWVNVPAWTATNYYTSPELKTIIQEIVDLSGWASGNNLLLMFRDQGSSSSAQRFSSSWDSASPEPVLYIYYIDENGEVGIATSECNLVPAVPRWTKARLDHVIVYDASGPSYTEVYQTALPHNLLPATPAVNDAVYFGMSSGRLDISLFNNIVLELSSFGNDFVEGWEYWTGAAWASLDRTEYPTSLGSGGSGRYVLNFKQPTNWASVAINGIDAFWVRILISSIGGAPTPPVQQTIDEFICSWPWIEINEEEIESDLPALLKWYATEMTPATGSWPANRMLIGSRNNRRGIDFVPYLNANTKILPEDTIFTISAGTETFLPHYLSGYSLVQTFGGATGIAAQCNWRIYYPTSRQYAGRFRVFLRCKVTTAAGTAMFKLIVKRGTITAYTSKTMYNYTANENVIDFGTINIAGNHLAAEDIGIYLQTGSTGALTVTTLDLILLPVDEMVMDVQTVDLTNADLMNEILDLYAIHDSTLPKEGAFTISIISAQVISTCITRILGPASIAPKQNVKLIFFAFDTRQASISANSCAGDQSTLLYRNEMVKQYQSMRGTK